MAWPLVAAVLGSAVLGAISGNKAANAQKDAASAAADQLRAGEQQGIGYLSPYAGSGGTALTPLTALLTGRTYNPDSGETQTLTPEQRMSSFLESPGYQFSLNEGLKAIEKSQAAKGTLLSGGGLKDLQAYAQGTASQEYGNYINQLMGLAGIGQSAATAEANTAIGTGTSVAGYNYLGGQGAVDNASNMSNVGFGLAGLGASMLGSNTGTTQNTTTASGGRYNPSYASLGNNGGSASAGNNPYI